MSPVVLRSRSGLRSRRYPNTPSRVTARGGTASYAGTAAAAPRIVASGLGPAYAGSVQTTAPTGYVYPGDLAGATPPAQMSYPLPTTNVAFVNPYVGTASGAGTQADPVQTTRQALAKITAGGTIVIGTAAQEYVLHEGVAMPIDGAGYSANLTYGGVAIDKANVTVQPYPGATVIYDGTSVQTGWTKTGTSSWSKALVITADRGATDSYGKLDNDSRGIGWLWVRSQKWHDLVVAAGSTEEQAQMFPLASWPEQVWIDGVRQTQVATIAEVVPGTFFIEGHSAGTNGVLWTSERYHLGTDPTGRDVRVSDLATSLSTGGGATGITIAGIKTRRYCGSVQMGGVVKSRAISTTFVDCIVEDCMIGFDAISDNAKFVRCEGWRCGVLSFKAAQVYGLRYDFCRSEYANFARFNWAPVSGGIKLTVCRNVVINGCKLDNGWTKGWWTDVSCYNVDVINTRCANNEQFGMVLEISAKHRIINCLVLSTGKDGILWHDSHASEMWHTTVKGSGRLRGRIYDSNNPRCIKIYQDGRRAQDSPADGGVYQNYGRDPRQALATNVAEQNNFLIEKIDIWNSIFDQGNALQFAYFPIEDLQKNDGYSRDISAYGLSSGGNLLSRASTTNPTYGWMAPLPTGSGKDQTMVTSLAQWRTVTGQDATTLEVLGTSPTDSSGVLLDRASYAAGGSRAVATQALTAEMAALIGVPAGTYPPGVIPIPVAGAPVAAHTARLLSGTNAKPARLLVLGDSIPRGAAKYGNTPPKDKTSYPGVLHTRLANLFGEAGSGWAPMNQDLWPIVTDTSQTANVGWESRLKLVGFIGEPALGPHGTVCLSVPDNGASPTSYIEFTETCTEVQLVLVAGTAGVVRYSVDGGASKTAQNTRAAQSVDVARTDIGSSQHVRVHIPVGALGQHTIRIWGDGAAINLVAACGMTYAGRIIVDNLGISGKSSGTFLSSAAGRDGLAYIETFAPDVLLIELGANSYNGAVAISTAQSQLQTIIDKGKAVGAAVIGTFPPQSDNSTLYQGGSAPTYTQYVKAFASTYGINSVPFLDLQYRWAPNATSEQNAYDIGKAAGYYADTLHPSDKGAIDLSNATFTFLGV